MGHVKGYNGTSRVAARHCLRRTGPGDEGDPLVEGAHSKVQGNVSLRSRTEAYSSSVARASGAGAP